ncbi:MAG: hypothetical protein KGR26_03090 [Cyanobacteria bacterium REEB65]|nr:hypothetical protein [Cyanobacteria bacterium REEB65]
MKRPSYPRRRYGFTLMETGLSVALGVVLLFAGVLAFDLAQDSSGDAVAKRKVADLETLVETDYSTNTAFPDLGTLQQQWLARRPQDATASPWGGPIVDSYVNSPPVAPCANGGCTNGAAGIRGMDLTGATASLTDYSFSKGNLYYYRIAQPGASPPACCWEFQDLTAGPAGAGNPQQVFTPAQGYMVGANKNFHCFYFVTSGRPTS